MKEVSITLIVCPIKLDEMMHSFGVFERFKRLILEPRSIEGQIPEEKTISEFIEKSKEAIESTNEYRVLAIFHPNLLEGAWCDREVILVSNGKTWGMFAELLTNLSYKGPLPKRYTDEVIV